MPGNSYITFAIKYTIVYLSYLYGVKSICFVIFVLIPINGFTVEYGRNENLLKIVLDSRVGQKSVYANSYNFATESVMFGSSWCHG